MIFIGRGRIVNEIFADADCCNNKRQCLNLMIC